MSQPRQRPLVVRQERHSRRAIGQHPLRRLSLAAGCALSGRPPTARPGWTADVALVAQGGVNQGTANGPRLVLHTSATIRLALRPVESRRELVVDDIGDG